MYDRLKTGLIACTFFVGTFARAGVVTGGAPALSLLKQCRLTLFGGKPHTVTFMTRQEAAIMRAVYDNSTLTPSEQITRAFDIWRNARIRSFGRFYARRIWASYETMPRETAFDLLRDAGLDDLADIYPLHATVFALIKKVHNLEHRIRILKDLGRLPREYKPEANIEVYLLEAEWEVTGSLPPSAYADATEALKDSGTPGQPTSQDIERRRRARVYLKTWAQAAELARGEFRILSARAKLDFTK